MAQLGHAHEAGDGMGSGGQGEKESEPYITGYTPVRFKEFPD